MFNHRALRRAILLLAFASLAGRAWADSQVPVQGTFAKDMGPWQLAFMEGATAEAVSEAIGQGKQAVHLTVTQPGAKRYYVQLVCKNVSLHAEKTYRLHFRARSKPAADLSVLAGTYHGKFEELWRQDHVALKEEWTEYNCDIKPKSTDEEAQIIFTGLAGQAGDYWFADVSLTVGN